MDGIFTALKEGALTMQQGGGVGYDFSSLRPYGSHAWSIGGIASGPVSFMRIWDSMCATLLSTGARRGAMMATLRCDHPDILAFIDAKRDPRELRHFNLSVLVSDAFMQAVDDNADWALVFPASQLEDAEAIRTSDTAVVDRDWPGYEAGSLPNVRVLRARKLWERLIRASYDYAEPGVLFIDRINHETISGTQNASAPPIPAVKYRCHPMVLCNLGSLNLTCFVDQSSAAGARQVR